jgi:hypothetical protein
MTTSNKTPPGAPSSYTRFIPREELKGFAAWNPASLEDPSANKPAPGESPAGGGVHKAPFAVRAGMSEGHTEPDNLQEAARDKACKQQAQGCCARAGSEPATQGPGAQRAGDQQGC